MAKSGGRSSSKTSSNSSTKTNSKSTSRGERGMMTPKAGFTATRRKVEYGGEFCY